MSRKGPDVSIFVDKTKSQFVPFSDKKFQNLPFHGFKRGHSDLDL